MKRLMLALVLTAISANVAHAQDPFADPSPSPSDSRVEQSPELYMLMKMMERYDDPKVAVRRKAEQKAAERRGRLASQKWYGYSQSRPAANPLPWMGSYSQHWVGNGLSPYQWVGPAYLPTTALRAETLQR